MIKTPAWVLEAAEILRRARARKMARERANAWNANHPDRARARWRRTARATHAERGETIATARRVRYRSDPVYRAKRIASSLAGCHVRRARIQSAPVGIGSDRVTAKAWAMQLEVFGHRCAYCLEPLANPHREHVIPLARGGAHAMSNLVPACERCNKHKNARGPLAMLGKV